jgi:hypothetical protein
VILEVLNAELERVSSEGLGMLVDCMKRFESRLI